MINSCNCLFSILDERYGLPTAGLTISSLVAFAISLKDGFLLTNRTLLISAALFFVGCAFAYWRGRDTCSISYVGEKESLMQRLRTFVQWTDICSVFGLLAIAVLFASLTAPGGHLWPIAFQR